MSALETLKNNLRRVDIDLILQQIIDQQKFKQEIIRLNTEEQLFNRGIDSTGRTLESIGGEYADSTIVRKIRAGQPTFPTLKDQGDFYASFIVEVGKGYFDIDANPIKEGQSLFTRWGEDVLGLADESLQKIINMVREEIGKRLRDQILRGV
jgi:hypothetical protein